MTRHLSLVLFFSFAFACTSTAQPLRLTHGDFVIKDFRFASGEVLPTHSELRSGGKGAAI